MSPICIKQAGNTLHTELTHIHTHTHRRRQHMQPGHKLRKICQEGSHTRHESERVSMYLDVRVSVSVSLSGGRQHDTQVLFWSIVSMRGKLEKKEREADLSLL